MTSPALRHALLVEFAPRNGALHPLAEALERLASELAVPSQNLSAYLALKEARVTAYLRDIPLEAGVEPARALAHERLGRLAASEVDVTRLQAVRAFAGASRDPAPGFHYVVRTDVAAGGEAELQRWYDEEHMPGLAAVPGAVLAQRMLSLDSRPRFYACYDLTSPHVLESAPWLAVRATDWSDRVRPTFRHTRRTMTRRLPGVGV